ncbi:CHASE2 domain-containing protein [Muricoccus pecuniae]|uniref:CHASE2 domain-containing protein n=1 Tax=Muricoccus pecuniae TaxID=693023 RepID=A0A840YFS0_9PROT|nr:CHASE2 domain-containing protein [Roseomonas pecuniae]MBB5695187.1 hypothetical protein [Roseomonas pecuniae]
MLIVLWVALEFLDPLGLGVAARRASAALFNALAGPVHGMSSPRAGDRIAVVEIGDGGASTEGRAAVWPIPLETHAQWLMKILEEGPRALFVDVRYQQRHAGEGVPALREVLDEARIRGIPILFSAGGPGWAPLPEELRPFGTLTAWPRQRERAYPLILEEHGAGHDAAHDAGGDAILHPAEATAPHHAGPHHDGTARQRVGAYDLYARLCAEGRLPEHCASAPRDADFANPLEIRWNAYPDPWQSALNSGCRTRDNPEWFERMTLAAKSLLRSMVSLTRNDIESRCRPNLTLDVNQWNRAREDGTGLPQWSLLRDRVVFFGFGTLDSNDRVDAALLGSVPGVQMHAQVFENLLAAGRSYTSLAPERHLAPGIGVHAAEMTEGLVWTATVLAAWWFLWRRGRSVQELRLPGCATSSRLTMLVLGGVGALMAIDFFQRGQTTGWPVLLTGYALLAIFLRLFLWTWQAPEGPDQAFALPRGEGWLRQVTAIPALGGLLLVLNELALHLAGTDWAAFVILYFSLMAEVNHASHASHEEAGSPGHAAPSSTPTQESRI